MATKRQARSSVFTGSARRGTGSPRTAAASARATGRSLTQFPKFITERHTNSGALLTEYLIFLAVVAIRAIVHYQPGAYGAGNVAVASPTTTPTTTPKTPTTTPTTTPKTPNPKYIISPNVET